MKVLILDQFTAAGGPLYVEKLKISDFEIVSFVSEQCSKDWVKPRIIELSDSEAVDWVPPYATTTYEVKEDGSLAVWRRRWDSSG